MPRAADCESSVDTMNLNPYDPSKLTSDVESLWSKLSTAAIRPMPVRRVASAKPRWLQVILHACAIVFAALAVAPLLTLLLGFLEPVAFPASVIICCFPIYIWMFYCRVGGVGRDSILFPVGLAFSLILSFAAVEGLASLPNVVLSLVILTLALGAEWMIGKTLLSALTNARANTAGDLGRTEP